MRRWLQRFWPDSLAGWSTVILGLAMPGLVVMALAFNHQAHQLAADQAEAFRLAQRIVAAAHVIEDQSPAARDKLATSLSRTGLVIFLGNDDSGIPTQPPDARADLLSDAVTGVLAEVPARPVRVALLTAAGSGALRRPTHYHDLPPRLRQLTDQLPSSAAYLVSVRLDNGRWMHAVLPSPVHRPFWTSSLIVGLLAGIVSVMLIAALAFERLNAPLDVLAQAAARLGQDIHAPPLPEGGARELRAAAHAFNEMQARLKALIIDRFRMAGAIAHDLRTPITRLRLQAEFIEDDTTRRDILANLAEMEMIVTSSLALARQEAVPEPRSKVDIVELVRDACRQVPGAHFIGEDVTSPPLQAQPVTLRRAILNILHNAVGYGDTARAWIAATSAELTLFIEDDGPGIPEDQMEAVFQPFTRLEQSRNRDTGGAGLGLAIARAAIIAHGGLISLHNRAATPLHKSGLTVAISLPHQLAGD